MLLHDTRHLARLPSSRFQGPAWEPPCLLPGILLPKAQLCSTT